MINGSSVTITAEASEGYVIPDEADILWTHEFKARTDCTSGAQSGTTDTGETLGTSTIAVASLPNTSASSTAVIVAIASTIFGIITIVGSFLRNAFGQKI